MKRLAITLIYCSRLHAWWSIQSRLATLLSSLIARRWVGLQTLWRFRLKDLSIGEMVGAWCFGCCQAHRGLPVGFIFLCYSVLFTVESLSLLYLFLYLDLYVLGDDALIMLGSFMQTKHLCVLIHIWTKGEVGAPLTRFKPSSKVILLTVPLRSSFCGSFMLFVSCFVILSCTSVCWCLVVTCWERADLLVLVCDIYLWRCHFPNGILSQVWCLIVSFHDLCPLSYLESFKIFVLERSFDKKHCV